MPSVEPEQLMTVEQAFRACREFIRQFNERERSETLTLLVESWMEQGVSDHDPLETGDPAQWHDWLSSVERTLAE